jgi:polyisoprenoid-binding protein YceI
MSVQPSTRAARTHWAIDPEGTSVEFVIGRLPIHRVRGRFTGVRGWAVTGAGALDGAEVEVEIAAQSINTGLAIRDRHLNWEPFLHTERFPAITFHSTRVEEIAPDHLLVFGSLTIRDVTRLVVLDSRVEHRDGERARITATATLDRRDFGIGPRLMGLTSGNEVMVRIVLELRAAGEPYVWSAEETGTASRWSEEAL